MHDGSTLITTREIAEAFVVDEDTVRLWCQNGSVPGAFRTPGGRWRIPESAITKIRERGTPAAAEQSSNDKPRTAA